MKTIKVNLSPQGHKGFLVKRFSHGQAMIHNLILETPSGGMVVISPTRAWKSTNRYSPLLEEYRRQDVFFTGWNLAVDEHSWWLPPPIEAIYNQLKDRRHGAVGSVEARDFLERLANEVTRE